MLASTPLEQPIGVPSCESASTRWHHRIGAASRQWLYQLSQHNDDYGRCLGEEVARCFSLDSEHVDDIQELQLLPIPDYLICRISSAVVVDPVATVDGSTYEKEYIVQRLQRCRQDPRPITSCSWASIAIVIPHAAF